MSIAGRQVINIGLPNESANSDSLYTAFHKINNNFETVFGCASPYANFVGGNGINVTSNANAITITNAGVLDITAGTGVTVVNNDGNYVISSTGGGGNVAGVTSVGITPVSNTRLVVTNSPIISSGNIGLDLATTGVANTNTTFTNPTITVDPYGRILNASNNTVSGTVTSIGLTPGTGIGITGGPITSSGTITVTNTGVTRLTAGTNISLSASNGNVTISAPLSSGTVTSVGLSSSTLSVSGSPVVSAGTITVDLPANVVVSGRLVLNGVEALADGAAANLLCTASYIATGASGESSTLAAGISGQIKTFMMLTDGGGDMVVTVANAAWGGLGQMTFGDVGDGCTLQYVNNKWFCIGNNGVIFT